MEPKDVLNVNSKMEFKIEGDNVNYKTTIQEVTDEYVAIYAPSVKGKEIRMYPGELVKARVFSKDAQYGFETTVLGEEEDNVKLYLLAVPSEVERIQMREFVRVKLQIPVKYEVLDEEDEHKGFPVPEKDCFTVDISGGGMQLLIPEKLKAGNLLAVEFKIHSSKMNNVLVQALGRVKRVERAPDKNKYCTGVFFEEIDENDRDTLIGYVFRKILEQRRLEVND